MVSAWIYGLKERLESKVIPRHQTCRTGESIKPLMVIDRFGKGGEWEGRGDDELSFIHVSRHHQCYDSESQRHDSKRSR